MTSQHIRRISTNHLLYHSAHGSQSTTEKHMTSSYRKRWMTGANRRLSTYGWAYLNDLGLSLIISNLTLDRIIDCAHYYKLNSIHDLKKETGWTDANKFGAEIVVLIQRHALPVASPFASIPLRLHLSSHVNAPSPPHNDLPSPYPALRISAAKCKIKCGAWPDFRCSQHT